jgi:beta-N-acetylhexosaminidase
MLGIWMLSIGCSSQQAAIRGSDQPDASAGSGESTWVDSVLHRLTLEEKVAQLVCVWTPGSYFPESSEGWRELERLTVERKLGGFVFSIGDVYSFAVEINKLQRMSDVPLLIASDFEYGTGMRVHSATTFPRAMAVGATRNPHYAYEIGKITALEGRALGVEQNYAPTVDVNNNPRNPVINTRSFGDNVELVSEMGAEFVKGTQDGGMIATIKHFPGHGDTDVDTHLGLMTLNYGRDRYDKVEFPPFEAAIKVGAKSVMVGHIAVPAYDTAAGIPASVSPHLIEGVLDHYLKFNGLVVTDALAMKGVSEKYHSGEASVLAIKAGADIVLMPPDPDVAIDAIIAAVKRGEISEERIDASVRKLLAMKQWAGLDRNRFVDVDKISQIVHTRSHELLAEEIARNAVTVLGNEKHLLPLPKVGTQKILDLVVSEDEDPATGRAFHGLLRDRYGSLDFVQVDSRSDSSEYASALEHARSADLILCQLHFYTRSGQRTGFIPDDQAKFLTKVTGLGKPVVAISFGNPYVAMEFPRTDAYVCAYSDARVMQQAVAEVLFAEEPARGKLPVTIPGVYKYGDGVEYPKQTLRSGLPEEAGFDSEELQKVDSVVDSAIADSAFPGAVLLVAKDGIIVHDKAYGSYDYGIYSKRVDVNTMYDLASVTKVIATTSSVMRLVDEGKIKLTDPVIKYIPPFGQKGKEKITLYNLMVHNSGLPAWRRFYDFCSTPQCLLDSLYATPLIYKTGDSTIYSDLGLITMGKVIEQVSHTTLDRYVDSVFFQPLGMTSTMYNPPQRLWNHIAPTEVDTFWRKTGQAVLGTVHDENASVLGGVSGHAGLFSTASDLAIMMQMLLNGGTYGGNRYLNAETIKEFTTRQSEESTRGIGWDLKSPRHSWAGTLLSDRTFLHTGFTGTSVAADPERDLIIIFLTNRVNPTRDNLKILAVRPKVHDAILRALKSSGTMNSF